jgi:hypothetical protein
MTDLKELYQKYLNYYRDNTWTFEDVRFYLKENKIDYEEYTFDEFCNKLNTDKKFIERWGKIKTTK